MDELQHGNDSLSENSSQTRFANTGNQLKGSRLIFLLIPLGLMLLFLFFFLATSSPQNDIQPTQITPQGDPQTNTLLAPTGSVIPTATEPVNLQSPEITWSPKYFSESEFRNITFQKTQLADGSTKYTYPSSNVNRPNEIIVKAGTVIYQQTVISGEKYVYHYTNSLEAPDYVFQGSRYYGTKIMVYVYVNKGTAFVADANTTIVREQINFLPMNIEDFKQKYGEDIIDFTIVPTLPPE